MKNPKDGDPLALNQEVDRVRKSARQRSPNLFVDDLIQQRFSRDSRKDLIEFATKLLAESAGLSFVPISRVADVVTRARTDANARRHFFLKSSSRTLSQASPVSGSRAYSSSASSSARRWDSGSGTSVGERLSHSSEIRSRRSDAGSLAMSSFVSIGATAEFYLCQALRAASQPPEWCEANE